MTTPIDTNLVRFLLQKMIAETPEEDKPGQAMIRKYQRLLAQHERAARVQSA